jgi:hypothetical protein
MAPLAGYGGAGGAFGREGTPGFCDPGGSCDP